jgi:hypothetical protein
MHSVGAAFPELNPGRNDSIATPEIWPWDILTLKSPQSFIELRI